MGDLATGRDWRNDPISDPEHSVGMRIMDYLNFVIGESEPIPTQSIMHDRKDSGFNMFEKVMGVRRAPDILQDPTGHGDMMRAVANRAWVTTLEHHKKQADLEGDDEKVGILQQEILKRKRMIRTNNYEEDAE
jgi:hypothetical protein